MSFEWVGQRTLFLACCWKPESGDAVVCLANVPNSAGAVEAQLAISSKQGCDIAFAVIVVMLIELEVQDAPIAIQIE